jgi:hypothetical protein
MHKTRGTAAPGAAKVHRGDAAAALGKAAQHFTALRLATCWVERRPLQHDAIRALCETPSMVSVPGLEGCVTLPLESVSHSRAHELACLG